MDGISSPSFRTLFDALPSPCLLVDEDVRILDGNAAALSLLGGKGNTVLRKRGGEALDCIHASETPGGCGHSEACRTCVIRNSVGEALRGGKPHRRSMKAEIAGPSGTVGIHLLVTAAPLAESGEPRVLLILEDVSELILLRDIIPICSWCKKIRNDEDYWESVESYFKTRADIDFSHGICQDCLAKLYPEK